MKNIFLFIGPSGSGKTYLANALAAKFPHLFKKVITATTRSPRTGEIHGVDYHFVSKDSFNFKDFAEFEQFGSNLYGTPISELTLDSHLIIAIEPKGCLSIIDYVSKNNLDKNTKVVFFNIDEATRLNNMSKRGDDPDQIKKRIEQDNILELIKNNNIKADLEFISLESISVDAILAIL